MSKVSKDVAIKDLDRFMESFRLDPIKKRKLQPFIEECIELVEEGMLVVNSDDKLEYSLLEPFTNEKGELVDNGKIVFNGKRILVKDLEENGKFITESEQMQHMVQKVTGLNKAFITKLSADDLTYITTIARFFMPVQ